MRGCGTTRETRATGVEAPPEKEAFGVAQVDPTQAPHLGEGLDHLTSSLHGATSLTSLLGASGSLHFLHACRHVLEERFHFYFDRKRRKVVF